MSDLADVAVDTSALSNFLDDQLRDQFVLRVDQANLRLVIPYLSVMEAMTQQKSRPAKERAGVILGLCQSLPNRFVIGGDLATIIPIELKRKGKRLERTPRIPDPIASRVFDLLTNAEFEKYHPLVTLELVAFLRKQEDLANDRGLRASAADAETPPSIDDLQEAMNGLPDRALTDSPFLDHWTTSRRIKRSLRGRPADRPCLSSWCTLAYMNGLGNVFAHTRFGPYAGILRGPKKDKWIDTAISACSAYARFFITDDDNQKNTLNSVAEKLGLSVKGISLSDFIES